MGNYFSVPLAIALAVPLVAGSIVSATTADNVAVWYKTLKKPSWNLPTPIFGPAWSFLYVFLGLASFVVWSQGGFQEQTGPLILYAVNLVLNLAWMPIFFNQKNFQLAQIDNLATLATAAWAAKWFYKIKPVAGYLLWPYVAFLTYANCLNYFHLKENGAEQPLTENLYREKGKENPGQAGYGGSNARASLAFPTTANHRSRTGRPVFVRAACMQKVAPTKLRMSVVRPKLSMMAAAPRSAAAAAWRA